jgi:hypothetical protein
VATHTPTPQKEKPLVRPAVFPFSQGFAGLSSSS